LFDNAISNVTPQTRLPVMLQYEHEFKLVAGSDTEIRKILPAEFNGLGLNERLHYANFGMAFYDRYLKNQLGPFMEPPEDNIGNPSQFVGWQAFVLKWKKP
jgi:hypothetical protein